MSSLPSSIANAATAPSHIKDEVDSKALELFEKCERFVEPYRGWILIRVLPREQRRAHSLIVLPEAQQNKLLLEGVVLRTFKPYWAPVSSFNAGRNMFRTVERTEGDLALVVPASKAGDHVIFPHFEGLPVGGILDENRYRLLEELVCTAKLSYHEDGWLVKQLVKALRTKNVITGRRLAAQLMEQFEITPKTGYESKTITGV